MRRPKGTAVRLPELPLGQDVYELRWLGELSVRGRQGVPSIEVLFHALEALRWVRLSLPIDRLPLLVLGSRWHQQTAIARERLAEVIEIPLVDLPIWHRVDDQQLC